MRLFKRKPTRFVATVQFNQNCFCGAALALTVPVIHTPDTDDTTYLLDIDAARESWHENHYHQLNPQLGSVVDFLGETDAVADLNTRRIGFPGT